MWSDFYYDKRNENVVDLVASLIFYGLEEEATLNVAQLVAVISTVTIIALASQSSSCQNILKKIGEKVKFKALKYISLPLFIGYYKIFGREVLVSPVRREIFNFIKLETVQLRFLWGVRCL